MRFQAPAAAVLCAVLVAIFLSFASSWPGTGIWMLPASLGLILLGAAWWAVSAVRPQQPEREPQRGQAASPFSAGVPRGQAAMPGMYGPGPSRRAAAREQPATGVPAAFIFIAAGLLGLMAFAGYVFTERDAPAAAEVASTGPERVAVERVDAELPAPAPAPNAEQETDSPPPAPAVPAGASEGQKAAAAAAVAAVQSGGESDADSAADGEAEEGSEEADDSVAQATPVELQEEEEAAEEEAEPEPRRYEVQAGDTLYGIAVGNDISMRLLLELNPSLSPSSLIHPGEFVNLPALESDDLLATSVAEDGADGSADDELMSEDDELLLEE